MQNEGNAVTSVAGTAPLKVAEVAAHLRVDATTVYREIKRGNLKAYRVGTGRGTVRVTAAAFAEYKKFITAAALEVA